METTEKMRVEVCGTILSARPYIFQPNVPVLPRLIKNLWFVTIGVPYEASDLGADLSFVDYSPMFGAKVVTFLYETDDINKFYLGEYVRCVGECVNGACEYVNAKVIVPWIAEMEV